MNRLCNQLGVGLLTVFLWAAPALAQQGASLADDIITASPPNSQQQAEVGRYVGEHFPKLTNADPRIRQDARNRLLRPLEGQAAPSPAFRLEYGRALGGRLTEYATHRDLGVALCAVRLAAALASEQGYLALKGALTDQRPGLRVAAASGMGSILAAFAENRHALTPASVTSAIQDLERALVAEREILAIDAMIVALGAPDRSELRPQAMSAMFRGMGGQVARLRAAQGAADEQELAVVLRAATMARDEVLRPNVPEALAKDAAILGGHLLSYSLARLEAHQREATGVDPSILTSIAIASDTVVVLSHGRLVPQDPVTAKIERSFPRAMEGGPIEPVRDAVGEWVGRGGRLTKAPYNAKESDFRIAPGAAAR